MQAVKNSEIFSFVSNPTPLTFIMTYEGHRCLVTTPPLSAFILQLVVLVTSQKLHLIVVFS